MRWRPGPRLALHLDALHDANTPTCGGAMGGDLGTKVATVGAVNVVEPGLVGVGAAARESVGLGADAGVRRYSRTCMSCSLGTK